MNAVKIRLQLGIESNPPVGPIDIQTDLAPQAWRGAGLQVDIGIFEKTGAAVDLTDLDFLEADIYPAAIFNQLPGTNFKYNPFSVSPYPNLPPAPLQFVTIPAEDITQTIPLDEWQAGNAQQASAIFSFVQMHSLELNGKPSADFWLIVSGQKADGSRIIYGGNRLTVYESGVQNIYLPNNVAPLDVPAGTILYIQPNQQLTFSETIVIDGEIVIDGGMLIQV